MKIRIVRFWENHLQTLSLAHVFDGNKLVWDFKVLELPWKDNQRGISCIPTGIYQAIKHRSPKFSECFWLQDVPGRSEILIHAGNFYTQIRGCLLAGAEFSDLNHDGQRDVTQSRETLKRLYSIMPDVFNVEILKK